MKEGNFLRDRGFTLVELMIVVAIIGAIISITVPRMANLTKKARQGFTKGMLATLRSATAIYYGDTGGMFPYQDSDLGGDNIEYICNGESTGNDGDINDTIDDNVWVPKYLSKIPNFTTGQRNYSSHEEDRDIAIVNYSHILSTQPVSSEKAEWIYINKDGTWRVNWIGPDVDGENPWNW